MAWTHFWDMNSGGGQKEKWKHIFIEAPRSEAIRIFTNRFDHHPERVTCTCCGSDYSISPWDYDEDDPDPDEEESTLEGLSRYHRESFVTQALNLYDKHRDSYGSVDYKAVQAEARKLIIPVEEWEKQDDTVLIIRAHEITKEERSGPDRAPGGYVWMD